MSEELIAHGAFHVRRLIAGDRSHEDAACHPATCLCPHIAAEGVSPAGRVEAAKVREAETAQSDAAWNKRMEPFRVAAGSVR